MLHNVTYELTKGRNVVVDKYWSLFCGVNPAKKQWSHLRKETHNDFGAA
jgi:hypothetical protein